MSPTDAPQIPSAPFGPGTRVRLDALDKLRAGGWSVAVHNDYRLAGVCKTFWLLTHPNGRWVKGEGDTDDEALSKAIAQAIQPDRFEPAGAEGREPASLAWDRERVCAAAVLANNAFGQWVPQAWLDHFIREYEASQ